MKNIAVITGASSGIGKEFLNQICNDKKYEFDEIWLIARRQERLKKIELEYKNVMFKSLILDLSNRDDLEKFGLIIDNENPNIKLLINNAGFGKIGKFDTIDIDEHLNMIDVNIKALTYITHKTLKYMKEGARIIQIASAAGFLPQPYFSVYAATKAYVLSFSRALARELKDRGIVQIAVCPGPVATEFFDVASKNGMPKSFKKFLVVTVDKVVKRALDDLNRGRDISIYGSPIKGFRFLSKILPHGFLMRFSKE